MSDGWDRAPGSRPAGDGTTFDGTSEAVAMGMVMEPPQGFLEDAVTRGLAIVTAEEALITVQQARGTADNGTADNSTANRSTANRSRPRRRDSGVFDLRVTPTDEPPKSARG